MKREDLKRANKINEKLENLEGQQLLLKECKTGKARSIDVSFDLESVAFIASLTKATVEKMIAMAIEDLERSIEKAKNDLDKL